MSSPKGKEAWGAGAGERGGQRRWQAPCRLCHRLCVLGGLLHTLSEILVCDEEMN